MSSFTNKLLSLNLGGAIKSWFDPAVNPSPIYIDPQTHTTPNNEDGWFFEAIGSERHYFRYLDYNSCVEAYRRCPPVAAIVNRKAQTLINGKTWVLNTKGKEATSLDAARIRNLFAHPNPLQSGKQFEAQGYIFQQLFGFNIVLPIYIGGDREFPAHMWNIPASWIDWRATTELFNRNGGVALTQIVVSFNGVRTIFQIADLLIIRDFTPSFNTLTFPASKITAMELPINNIIGAFESRNVLINNRGPLGILTANPGKGTYQPIPLTAEKKKDLQNDFKSYGLRRRQWQVIITSAALSWQQMGFATKDLLLMEEVVESTKSLCDGLNYPPHLLGLIDPTFNNQDAAEKGLYQNATIPDADNIYEHWNTFFKTDTRNIIISKNFDHISVLQENKEALGRARSYLSMSLDLEWKNGWLKLNRVLELLGEDTIGTEGEIYYQQWLTNNPQVNAQLQDVTTQSGKQILLESLFNFNTNGNGKEKIKLPAAERKAEN